MRHRTTAAGISLATALLMLGGCGGDDPARGSTAPKTIEVTFTGSEVTPKGERMTVEAGQKLEFVVTADVPGEIHVHSSPEQEFEYDAGTSTHEIVIKTPGIVEVESHNLDVVVLQLEVR